MSEDPPHVYSLDWSSEGFGIPDDNGVPAEYLFDGGATDAVSNNRSQLLNYIPLSSPVQIRTATDDSNVVYVCVVTAHAKHTNHTMLLKQYLYIKHTHYI